MSPKEYITANPGCTLEEIKTGVSNPKDLTSKLNALVKEGKIEKSEDKYFLVATSTEPSSTEARLIELENKMLKKIDELDRLLTKDKTDRISSGELRAENVPLTDELEAPAVFYAIGYSKLYFGYKNRVGQTVQPPYSNPEKGDRGEAMEAYIKFSPAFRKEGRTKKEYVHYCYYICYSKKVLEWLRKHPLYGVEFHEKLETVTNIDQREQALRTQAYLEVNAMSEGTVYSAAKSRPAIKMTDDMGELRKRLAECKIEEAKKDFANRQVQTHNNIFQNMDAGNNAKAPIPVEQALDFRAV